MVDRVKLQQDFPHKHLFKSYLLHFWYSLSLICVGRHQKVAWVLKLLPPMWLIQMEFLVSDLGWPNPSHCGLLGRWTRRWKISSVSLSLSLCLSNKWNKSQKIVLIVVRIIFTYIHIERENLGFLSVLPPIHSPPQPCISCNWNIVF